MRRSYSGYVSDVSRLHRGIVVLDSRIVLVLTMGLVADWEAALGQRLQLYNCLEVPTHLLPEEMRPDAAELLLLTPLSWIGREAVGGAQPQHCAHYDSKHCALHRIWWQHDLTAPELLLLVRLLPHVERHTGATCRFAEVQRLANHLFDLTARGRVSLLRLVHGFCPRALAAAAWPSAPRLLAPAELAARAPEFEVALRKAFDGSGAEWRVAAFPAQSVLLGALRVDLNDGRLMFDDVLEDGGASSLPVRLTEMAKDADASALLDLCCGARRRLLACVSGAQLVSMECGTATLVLQPQHLFVFSQRRQQLLRRDYLKSTAWLVGVIEVGEARGQLAHDENSEPTSGCLLLDVWAIGQLHLRSAIRVSLLVSAEALGLIYALQRNSYYLLLCTAFKDLNNQVVRNVQPVLVSVSHVVWPKQVPAVASREQLACRAPLSVSELLSRSQPGRLHCVYGVVQEWRRAQSNASARVTLRDLWSRECVQLHGAPLASASCWCPPDSVLLVEAVQRVALRRAAPQHRLTWNSRLVLRALPVAGDATLQLPLRTLYSLMLTATQTELQRQMHFRLVTHLVAVRYLRIQVHCAQCKQRRWSCPCPTDEENQHICVLCICVVEDGSQWAILRCKVPEVTRDLLGLSASSWRALVSVASVQSQFDWASDRPAPSGASAGATLLHHSLNRRLICALTQRRILVIARLVNGAPLATDSSKCIYKNVSVGRNHRICLRTPPQLSLECSYVHN